MEGNGGDILNVYDFDNTIYDGESTLDFYFFCVKHHPRLVRFVFIILSKLIKYKMCLVSEQELMSLCEKYVRDFLSDCPDAKELAEKFWQKKSCRLKDFYKRVHREDDVVISASFGFLLRPAMDILGVKHLVCSEVNLENGDVERLCFRKNKKQIFEELFRDEKINDFYTDSLNDLALMKLATGSVYMVKGKKVNLYTLL